MAGKHIKNATLLDGLRQIRPWIDALLVKGSNEESEEGLKARVDEVANGNVHSLDLVLQDRMDRLMVHWLLKSGETLGQRFASSLNLRRILSEQQEQEFISLVVRHQQYGYLLGRAWVGTAFVPVRYSSGILDGDYLKMLYTSLLAWLETTPKDAINATPHPIREVLVQATIEAMTKSSIISVIHRKDPCLVAKVFVFLLQTAAHGTWQARLEHSFLQSRGVDARTPT